jgi:hypothetical protein
MTITRAPAAPAHHAMPGDLVRIALAAGAMINGLPAAAGVFATGAFGKIGPMREDGSRVLEMHELMPAEIAACQTISLTHGTMVERISVDNENEVAILALQYMRDLKDFIRERMSSASSDVLRNVLIANLKADADRVAIKLAASGISVVEKITTKTVVTKSVYLTSNPQAMKDGATPSDVVSFEFEADSKVDANVTVHDASRAQEVLFSPVAVADGVAPAAGGRPDAVDGSQLTPFMRHMLGMPMNPANDHDLNLGDLIGPGDGDSEPDDAPIIR